jgi:hypothetical protein
MNQSRPGATTAQAFEHFQQEHAELLNAMYDRSVADCGNPLEFRLFDAQVCSHLDFTWLFEQVKTLGMSQTELPGAPGLAVFGRPGSIKTLSPMFGHHRTSSSRARAPSTTLRAGPRHTNLSDHLRVRWSSPNSSFTLGGSR